MSAIKFENTSFGPGALVRFKDVKSHAWRYAIYRGVRNNGDRVVGYEFSQTPLGPVDTWLAYWPKFMECATAPWPDRGDS